MASNNGMINEWLKEFRVIDGGLGTAACDYSSLDILNHAMYSSRLLLDAPNVVEDIHKAFLEAGADILETNSYQASVSGFVKHMGVSEDVAISLFKKSVDLARSARDSLWPQLHDADPARPYPLVVGSVGPYGGYQADLSEYTGAYMAHLSYDDIKEWHRPQIAALASAPIDLLAFDTLPALGEAVALAELLRDEFPQVNCWMSFCGPLHSATGLTTCQGEALEDVARALSSYEQVVALGVNCLPPSCVSAALRCLQPQCATSGKTLLVYPNSGENYTEQREWHFTENQPAEKNEIVNLLPEWVKLGARWIGGCCRVHPKHISAIAAVVQQYRKDN